jgi:lipopolysaccharide transport system ATP-binding protein
MNNTAIKVSHLTKVYKLYDKPVDRLKEALHPLKKKYHKDFYALSDVSFEIKKGETVGIIGKNGAGKSTLLKIITGVLTPSSGHVHVNGRIASLLELGAGFNPEYTGIENIYLQGTLMGYSHAEMQAKVDEILAFADIGDFVHQPVKMYSSGMFARLAFAVAINVDPDILIVDEALSVGDAAFQRKCFARMEVIRIKGTTIVFVSHSEGQIVELCNRAIFVHGGEIILDGEPKRVTGLYSKSMNSGIVDTEAIKEEFKNPPKNDLKKINKNLADATLIIDEENDFEEYFDQSLLPLSVIEYQSNNAKISNVQITTLDGKEVNTLLQGRNYYYCYDVEFYESHHSVSFGMLIKTTSGLELGGGSFPGVNKTISHIPKGKQQISWQFCANMNEGIYFTNAGIISMGNKESTYAHRLLDAYGFKVIKSKNISTAYIDFELSCSIKESV